VRGGRRETLEVIAKCSRGSLHAQKRKKGSESGQDSFAGDRCTANACGDRAVHMYAKSLKEEQL